MLSFSPICDARLLVSRFAHPKPLYHQFSSRGSFAHARRRVLAMAEPAFEAWVKGDPDNNVLGDCPFCHRALLTLEEKKVPHDRHYIDFAKKPDWLFKINPKGSVPAFKDLQTGKWLTDSAEIVDYLEDKYPEPKLGKSDSIPDAGSQIFSSFVKYLKAADGEDMEAKNRLVEELKGLSTYLKGHGPYIKGDTISAADLALGPKLYHALTATKHYKGLELPVECKPVQDYLARLQSRESWKKTLYSEDLVNAGWKSHLQG